MLPNNAGVAKILQIAYVSGLIGWGNEGLSEVDAIIILSNLMAADGSLNRESAARAKKGVEAFRDNKASVIVTCGWAYRKDSSICIGDAVLEHIAVHHKIDVVSRQQGITKQTEVSPQSIAANEALVRRGCAGIACFVNF